MKDMVVGVDLGGTNIKVGLVDGAGGLSGRLSAPTPPAGEGAAGIARAICRAVRRCAAEAGLEPAAVRGVGVGSPGTMDLEAGVVDFSPNLPALNGAPLRGLIQDDIGLPCTLENDANAAALAECWIGAGKDASSLVLLTLGTGIGGGIVLDGQVWHGCNGVAGEIGHMVIDADGPLCGCGNRGCLESLASATAMVRRMQEAVRAGVPTSLAARADELTARDIHEAALAGDAAARENIEATGHYLGLGVANIMHVLNPRVIAFSGGVTAAGDMLLDPIKEGAARRALDMSQREVTICYSRVPADAGIIGAARCFMQG